MRETKNEAVIHQCLIENYEKYYRIAYSYVFQEQDAMDIVQESAYRAILKSKDLKHPDYADTWICRIVMNEAVRFLEKYRKRSAQLNEAVEEAREDPMQDLDLRRALDKLDDKERQVVVLRYFEEEKLENIGRILDENTNTVKSRLYRAIGKLKKYMENGGAEYEKMESRI